MHIHTHTQIQVTQTRKSLPIVLWSNFSTYMPWIQHCNLFLYRMDIYRLEVGTNFSTALYILWTSSHLALFTDVKTKFTYNVEWYINCFYGRVFLALEKEGERRLARLNKLQDIKVHQSWQPVVWWGLKNTRYVCCYNLSIRKI